MTKMCHRMSGHLFTPPVGASIVEIAGGKREATQQMMPCIGPRCALFVEAEGQPGGICGDTLQAIALSQIAAGVTAFAAEFSEGDVDPDPKVNA